MVLAWTEVNDVNTARYFGAGGGVSTLAFRWISDISTTHAKIANTEYWNGTTWTEVADLATARSKVWWSWNRKR
jgi:hypothetical protein